jgi:hypothetical protein
MKRLFLLIAFIYMVSNTYADNGNCIKYKVSITLIDNEVVHGYVICQTYNPRFEFPNNDFKSYVIKESLNQDMLTVYSKIYDVDFPKIGDDNAECDLVFNASPSHYIRTIHKDDIQEIDFEQYSTCNNCDNPDVATGYPWNGYYPVVVNELTMKEIYKLREDPVAITQFVLPGSDVSLYFLISYNERVDNKEIKSLSSEFMSQINDRKNMNKSSLVSDYYDEFKSDLRKRNVILLKLGVAL